MTIAELRSILNQILQDTGGDVTITVAVATEKGQRYPRCVKLHEATSYSVDEANSMQDERIQRYVLLD